MVTCALCKGRGYVTSLDCVGQDDACNAAVEERHTCSCQPEDAGPRVHVVVGRTALVVRSRERTQRPFGFADR